MGIFRFLRQWKEKKDGTLEGPAISTKQAQIGSSTAVSGGPVGDSGEWYPIASFKPTDASLSTTSTSWTVVSDLAESVFLDTGKISDLTNISDVGISWAGYVENNTDNEDVSVRYRYSFTALTETVETRTGSGPKKVASQIERIDDIAARDRTEIQMKVTGGTGSLEGNTSLLVWGKVK
jgi:hypothetical protein